MRSIRKKSGFSNIELLVVIVIAFILMAILFPVLQSVRATASRAGCVSNMRQIYSAMMIFAGDHDGMLPPDLGIAGNDSRTARVHPRFNLNSYWWTHAYLAPYLLGDFSRSRYNAGQLVQSEVEVLNCPARFVDGPDQQYQPSNGNPAVSYVMRRLNNSDQHQYYRHHRASETILLTEGRSSSINPTNAITGNFGSSSSEGRLRRYHNGSLNIMFFDGRLESFSGSDAKLGEQLEFLD